MMRRPHRQTAQYRQTTDDPHDRLLSPGRLSWLCKITDVSNSPISLWLTAKQSGPSLDQVIIPTSKTSQQRCTSLSLRESTFPPGPSEIPPQPGSSPAAPCESASEHSIHTQAVQGWSNPSPRCSRYTPATGPQQQMSEE